MVKTSPQDYIIVITQYGSHVWVFNSLICGSLPLECLNPSSIRVFYNQVHQVIPWFGLSVFRYFKYPFDPGFFPLSLSLLNLGYLPSISKVILAQLTYIYDVAIFIRIHVQLKEGE